MIATVLKHTGRFAALILVQVLLLNNIDLGGYLNPMLYILIVLSLPIETSRSITMIIGMGTGFAVDVFTRTPGLHMSAGVFLGFMRTIMLRYMAPRDGYEPGVTSTLSDMGTPWYLTYAGILTLLHHFYLFFAEAFTVQFFFRTLSKSLLSTAVTLVLIIIVQLFGTRNKLRR